MVDSLQYPLAVFGQFDIAKFSWTK